MLYTYISSGQVLNIGSQKQDEVDLDLWHLRLADYFWLVRHIKLFVRLWGIGSLRRCSIEFFSMASVLLRHTNFKMRQISFPAIQDRLEGLSPGLHLSADVRIILCIPSRGGYHYFDIC